MCRVLEHLTGPSIETAASLEDRLDPAPMMSTTNRHVEAHHVWTWRLGLVAQRDGPGADEHAELLLKPLADDVAARRNGVCDFGENVTEADTFVGSAPMCADRSGLREKSFRHKTMLPLWPPARLRYQTQCHEGRCTNR
jgi:hypothetical protein